MEVTKIQPLQIDATLQKKLADLKEKRRVRAEKAKAKAKKGKARPIHALRLHPGRNTHRMS